MAAGRYTFPRLALLSDLVYQGEVGDSIYYEVLLIFLIVSDQHALEHLSIEHAMDEFLRLDRGSLGRVRRYAPFSVYRICVVLSAWVPPVWAYACKLVSPTKQVSGVVRVGPSAHLNLQTALALAILGTSLFVGSILSRPEARGTELAVMGAITPNPFAVLIFGLAEMIQELLTQARKDLKFISDLGNHMLKHVGVVFRLAWTVWELAVFGIWYLFSRVLSGIYFYLCMAIPSYRTRPELCSIRIFGFE